MADDFNDATMILEYARRNDFDGHGDNMSSSSPAGVMVPSNAILPSAVMMEQQL